MENKITPRSFALALAGTILLSTSCGPVYRFTRVKKVPREYSMNYCGEETKAPRTALNKEPWVVYSDREKNQSNNTPGGNVKAKDVDFLDPFLVIGKKHKGEYLKLVKYTPDILKNGKLDYKKAEYYGWMHKSKLVLNRQTVTDIASGKKNKMLALFSDTLFVNEPEKYFGTDSIKLFRDMGLKSASGMLQPYCVVYPLKQSDDGSMVLVAKKPYIQPETAQEDILGWVGSSLVKDIGTGLHVDLQTIPPDKRKFRAGGNGAIPLSETLLDDSRLLAEQYKTVKYFPVTSYSAKDSLIAFKTRMALPLFDYSDNYIFNVDGGRIPYGKFRKIAKGLRKINISFVFEGGGQTIGQFPQIVNALQNLQQLFEGEDGHYAYRFNCVMGFDETGKLREPANTGFTADYMQIVNFLSDKANQKGKLRAISDPRTSWPALRKSVELFDMEKDAANLIVLVGEKRSGKTGVGQPLTDRILRNNCRIIGFQVFGGKGDEYNNFVNDIVEAINSYADGMMEKKREILVSPEQIKRRNLYVEAGGQRNSYRLDFPGKSITQGAVFFPGKSEILQMEMITNNIDTIIQQIKQDNTAVTGYMSGAFRSVGNNRTKFDSLYLRNYGMDSVRAPHKKLVGSFGEVTPGWYLPSGIIVLDRLENKAADYQLMLSGDEMEALKEFVASLSAKEVDFITTQGGNGKAKKKRKPCNCPEDDLFAELENEGPGTQDMDTVAGKGVPPGNVDDPYPVCHGRIAKLR